MAQEDEESAVRRPPPQPAWSIDARAGAACQAEVLQGIERLLGLLQVGSAAPPAATLRLINRRLGRQLSPALLAAADLMQGHAATFQLLPFAAPMLRQLDVRIRVLENSKAALAGALAAVGDEIDACRVLGGQGVDAVHRTVQKMLEDPGAAPVLRRPLRQASAPLARAFTEGERETAAEAPLSLAGSARLDLPPALLAARLGGRRGRPPGPRSARSPRRR